MIPPWYDDSTKCPCCPEGCGHFRTWDPEDVRSFLQHVWLYHCRRSRCPCGHYCGWGPAAAVAELYKHLGSLHDPLDHLRYHHMLNALAAVGEG